MLFYSTAQAQYSAPWIQPQVYNGPDDFYCITDALLERYLNNPLVNIKFSPGYYSDAHNYGLHLFISP